MFGTTTLKKLFKELLRTRCIGCLTLSRLRLATLMLSPFVVLAISVAISITLSRGWSFLDDALSDLGDPSNGLGAVVFNAGLALTGYLLLFPTLFAFMHRDRVGACILSTVSLFTILVAVLNISFGIAHIVVATCLFVSMTMYVLYNACIHRSKILALGLAISISAWVLHFVYGIPRGIAVPETISIVLTVACYVRYAPRLR